MEYLTYCLYRLLSAVIGALPLAVGIRMGRGLGFIGYYILPGYRAIALRNLSIAFPEKTDTERRTIARKHFRTLVGNLFASEKLSRMSVDQILTHIEVQGLEHLRALTAQKRGFLL